MREFVVLDLVVQKTITKQKVWTKFNIPVTICWQVKTNERRVDTLFTSCTYDSHMLKMPVAFLENTKSVDNSTSRIIESYLFGFKIDDSKVFTITIYDLTRDLDSRKHLPQ